MARPTDVYDEVRRRFVEAARRAQIVTILNRASTEAELGELLTAELCEVFEAEIAFVLAADNGGKPNLIGAYGLAPHQCSRLRELGFLERPGSAPWHATGAKLLSVGARTMLSAPFGNDGGRGLVGVGRLYDQAFDDAEAALLESVSVSVEHALERLRVAEERDRLYRKAHERGQAARVLGSVADGVVLVDHHGTVQLWNPAAEAITGLPHDAVVGRPLADAIGGWSVLAESLAAAGESTSSGRATTVPVDVDGRELWLSIRGVALGDGIVYAFRDLTEDHRLEQLKADFIATVSHELRTPLAAVHGAAKTLQRDDVAPDSDVFRHLLAVVSEQSERLSELIDDILLASAMDSPEFRLSTEHVDVRELADEVIAAARVHAHDRLRLELNAPPTLPLVVADRDKVRQVLSNLVANAVKYSPAGGLVEVELRETDRHLELIVRDEGLGIRTADQRLIFEKFYRVDANMTGGVSGSGLGLYICRELVHRMGGAITVESEPGRGSTFVVSLPVMPAS